MTCFNSQFQYYSANIKDTKPKGNVKLSQFIDAVINPKPHIVQVMNRIRKAAEEGDVKTKTKLKESLFYFTPCVSVKDGRSYKNIQNFTGLLVLDFDKLESRDYAEQMKESFFNTFESVVFAWLSSSGKGFRAIMQIPTVNSVDEFKEYFRGAQRKFGDLDGFDPAPKNPVLPLFLSIDRKALVRENSVMFMEKYTPPPPVKRPVKFTYSDESNRVLRLIEYKINDITDAGHPIVRATSYYVGGLCAAGHCPDHVALSKLEECIRNHPYTGNPAKVKTYLKTMHTMFEKGKQSETNFIQR